MSHRRVRLVVQSLYTRKLKFKVTVQKVRYNSAAWSFGMKQCKIEYHSSICGIAILVKIANVWGYRVDNLGVIDQQQSGDDDHGATMEWAFVQLSDQTPRELDDRHDQRPLFSTS